MIVNFEYYDVDGGYDGAHKVATDRWELVDRRLAHECDHDLAVARALILAVVEARRRARRGAQRGGKLARRSDGHRPVVLRVQHAG